MNMALLLWVWLLFSAPSAASGWRPLLSGHLRKTPPLYSQVPETIQDIVSATTNAIDQFDPDIIEELIKIEAPLIEIEEEAAVLEDLAEVSSDLGMIFAPETVLLRLSAVVSKILDLTSDYLPDHMIRSDEFVFGIPLLVTSVYLLVRSATPILAGQFEELDELDRTAFELCFGPVGVTMLQFKGMKALGCFEWVTYEAGEILIDEDEYNDLSYVTDSDDDNSEDIPDLYWQFEGDTIFSFRGNVYSIVERINGMHIDDSGAQGLLGDTRFVSFCEGEPANIKNDEARKRISNPIGTITIGPKGATLLQINSRKLFELMDNDERLESSIRLLLLKSLKLKIGNLLLAQKNQMNIRRSNE